MTRNVYSVDQNEKIEAALNLMEEKMVRRLPVVNQMGMIVGIISLADIIAKARMLKVALMMRSLAKRTRKYGVALA
jgi:CBS domain-containing protein